MKRGFVIALFVSAYVASVWGDILPNDHGSTPATATALPGGSNTISGVLEHDLDVDVFSFPFKPWTSYTIAVETGTVRDVHIQVLPPAGPPSYGTTNSVWAGAAAFTNLAHQGAQSRWFIAVSGMFQFTTGSYHLAVWEHPGQDINDSGFPDAWELHYFGDLETADPALHMDAYWTGRDPTADPLAIDSLQQQTDPARDVIGWTLAPYAAYDLFTSTNLVIHDWEYVDTHTAGDSGGLWLWTNEPAVGPHRFYKIRFRAE